MDGLTSFFISIFSAGTILVNIISILLTILLFAAFVNPKNKSVKKLESLIANNYVPIILIITALATAGSLMLSEVVNFPPCKLCWYQRIFMYPQAVVAFVALITNDNKIRKYILPLSLVGFLIAGYHLLLQIFPNVFQCSDEVARCSTIQLLQFGYVTIPVMALSTFLFLILVSLVGIKFAKK